MTKIARTTTPFIILAVLVSLLLASCAAAKSQEQRVTSMGAPGDAYMAPSVQEVELAAQPEYGTGGAPPKADAERMVIKNAQLSLVVADPAASLKRISDMADEMGGFVVSANLYRQQLESGVEVPRAEITIRVPAGRLNEALDRIRQESDQIPLTETVNSQDVTADYTDLQSRLRNLEEAERQLRNIMDSATKTEDVLAVYNELVRTREQIEVIKGQMQYYEQSSALSSISTTLVANEAIQPLTIGRWQPVGVAKQAIQALISAFKFIVNAAIWIILFVLPVLLLLFVVFILPLYLVIRFWRRRRKARSQVQTPEVVNPPGQPGE